MPAPSPQVEHAILDLVARGWSVSRAARYFGIHPRTARDWSSGRYPAYGRFAQGVRDARLEHERELQDLASRLRERVRST